MLSRRDVLFVLGALPAMTFAAESTAENYDVIVVGSGAAGLSAAVSAAQNGSKRVLVLEKNADFRWAHHSFDRLYERSRARWCR